MTRLLAPLVVVAVALVACSAPPASPDRVAGLTFDGPPAGLPVTVTDSTGAAATVTSAEPVAAVAPAVILANTLAGPPGAITQLRAVAPTAVLDYPDTLDAPPGRAGSPRPGSPGPRARRGCPRWRSR